MLSVQEETLQGQASLQFGSQKCLSGPSGGQEEFGAGREDELQSARGEVETLLPGGQTANLSGVPDLQTAQESRLLADR